MSEECNKEVEIWFQDESRIGQQGSLSRIWAKKGIRPRVVKQQQYLSTYLFGAISPENGKSSALILPKVNNSMMEKHLFEIGNSIAPGKTGILVVDRAAWHTSKNLVCPSNIKLLPLPAASPELNPMEQVWQTIKRRELTNRCYSSEKDLISSVSDAWINFAKNTAEVKSLCKRDWAEYRIN